MAPDEAGISHKSATPPWYFKEALEDAELLMKYAAEIGVEDIREDTRAAVLHAREVYPNGWSEDVAAKLLLALTELAARLKPVTAASLRATHSDTRPTMHSYLLWAILLAAVIIPASVFNYVSSNISDAIGADVTKANALAVKLTTELGPPERSDAGVTEKVTDLQEYASLVRSIFAHARRLNLYVFPRVAVPPQLERPESLAGVKDLNDAQKYELAQYLKQTFELPIPLDENDLARARNRMTTTYQDVRYFAQTIRTDTSTFYGAINSIALPILYALLGTCAYLLRSFEDQMSTRTFVPSAANSARFLIAAIGGTVIGLFSDFSQQISASPLAVAFLVGYGADVFFSFLEGLTKAFSRSPAGPAVKTKT
jgi:hypothetical protein